MQMVILDSEINYLYHKWSPWREQFIIFTASGQSGRYNSLSLLEVVTLDSTTD